MPRKRHKPEEIVAKLGQVDVLVSQGKSIADAVRSIGVTEGCSCGEAARTNDTLAAASFIKAQLNGSGCDTAAHAGPFGAAGAALSLALEAHDLGIDTIARAPVPHRPEIPARADSASNGLLRRRILEKLSEFGLK